MKTLKNDGTLVYNTREFVDNINMFLVNIINSVRN